jgi:crotonobetainyl-CoA:carnitine CoA-transferase CaiB-like acyl-CoA transferase
MVPGCPVKLSDSPVEVAPAPLLGQHTADVLGDLLGLTEEDLVELRQESIV